MRCRLRTVLRVILVLGAFVVLWACLAHIFMMIYPGTADWEVQTPSGSQTHEHPRHDVPLPNSHGKGGIGQPMQTHLGLGMGQAVQPQFERRPQLSQHRVAINDDRNKLYKQLQAEQRQHMSLQEEFLKRKNQYTMNVTKLKYILHDAEKRIISLESLNEQMKANHYNLLEENQQLQRQVKSLDSREKERKERNQGNVQGDDGREEHDDDTKEHKDDVEKDGDIQQ